MKRERAMEFNTTVNCTLIDENTLECFGERFTRGEGGEGEGIIRASNPLFWVYLIVYLVLVLFAGKKTCY